MKLSALLTRQKGRDFYDVLFLWQRTKPDYAFLAQSQGIENEEQLRTRLQEVVAKTDLKTKQRDFEHLCLNLVKVSKSCILWRLQVNNFQLFHVRRMTEGSPKDDRVEQLAFFQLLLRDMQKCMII